MGHTRNIPPFEYLKGHNETNKFLVEFIKNADDKPIPKSNPHPMKYKVPWWSDKLTELINIKHSLGRLLDNLNKRFNKMNKKIPILEENLQKITILLLKIDVLKPLYNKISAKLRKEVIQGIIISWRKYVSDLSYNTPIKKIWEKFRKINGSHIRPPRHAILKDGNKILNSKEISNVIGENLAKVSSEENLDEHFRTKKNKMELITVNFE